MNVKCLDFVQCASSRYKYSVETLILHTLTEVKMKHISRRMLAILERLAEMFPDSSYQIRLDQYLSTKGITDAAQLENYINEFNYSHKEQYL